MEGKKDKSSGLDLGALERDLLEYQFSEDDDDGDVDGHLLLSYPLRRRRQPVCPQWM